MKSAIRISDHAADAAQALFPESTKKHALEQCVFRYERLRSLTLPNLDVFTPQEKNHIAPALKNIPLGVMGSFNVLWAAIMEQPGPPPGVSLEKIKGQLESMTAAELFFLQETIGLKHENISQN